MDGLSPDGIQHANAPNFQTLRERGAWTYHARGVMPHEVVAALGRELQARAPTVFVLEDAHWADEATLDVVTLLGRRVETVPALITITFRDDELDRAQQLRAVLGELGGQQTRRLSGSYRPWVSMRKSLRSVLLGPAADGYQPLSTPRREAAR